MTVSDSYWDTQRTGQSDVIGDDEDQPWTEDDNAELETAEMQGKDAADEANMGENFDFDTIWETNSSGYPILAFQRDGLDIETD